MEFFLPFKTGEYPFKISYQDKILFIGSCFSEEIGNKMSELKFNVLQNPNGILYDPLSISESIRSYIHKRKYYEDGLVQINDLWHSWKHHSIFSGLEKEKVLERINRSQSQAAEFIRQARVIIITLGTGYSYQLIENGQCVSNCHKAPGTIFKKTLLPSQQITEAVDKALKELIKVNPVIHIIITVSPVKHVRDGVVENVRSKARLIESAHSIAEQNENAYYFPSYELVTDVLRDYRFYKEDLVHPNESAIDFVFENFCASFLDDESKKIIVEIKKIGAAVNHRPFVKESEAHKKFIATLMERITEMEKQYPFLNFEKEKQYFEG